MAPQADARNRTPESALAKADAGDVDGAVAALREAVAADEDDDASWLTLGMVLAKAERWDEALPALARAVDLDGDVLLGRVLYARALERAGKLDDAVFQLLRAAKIDAAGAGILRELGSLFYKKKLYDKSLQWLLKAKAAAGSDPAEQARALYAIGLAQEARRDPGAAIAAYREAIRLDPKHLDAQKTLADALAGIGELAQAVEVLDELQRVDPTNEQAATNREVLDRALADMQAHRLWGKTVRELESSALVQAGQMKRKGRTLFGLGAKEETRQARYANRLSELQVTFADDRTIEELFLALTDPEAAARKRDTMFQVTVVGKDGSRVPATYATGATLTFLRESMGLPMTQAGELYARLLGGAPSIEYGGLEARFVTREDLNGLLVARRR